MADALLEAVGVVAWVEDEGLIDACTAVSGSGPAYVFLLCEELARGRHGGGAAGRSSRRDSHAPRSAAPGPFSTRATCPAATLRENVTSKGGTTAAALEVLMAEDGLSPLMREAVAAAKRRAGELSG